MKITRFVQSCLLIEDDGSRIVIDPSGEETGNNFGKLDAVLYTHEHADHFDSALTKKFMEARVPVYANASTAKQIAGQPNVVNDGQDFSVGTFKIKVLELLHCLLTDGSEGPQNSGYLVNGKLFHPGDGKELKDFSVDNLALPISGPDVSLKDAFDFLKQVSAKSVVPIHYDFIGTKPEVFEMFANMHNVSVKIHILAHGESMEV